MNAFLIATCSIKVKQKNKPMKEKEKTKTKKTNEDKQNLHLVSCAEQPYENTEKRQD